MIRTRHGLFSGLPPAAIGPLVTPAVRFAAELYGRATTARPRDWCVTPGELAGRAEEDIAARDLLLYYAAAVARDTGDHARADALLSRALAKKPTAIPWVQEFELQMAMADALVRGDTAAARARLAKLPPHATEPTYPLLAEAVVLVAEGRRDEATKALDQWNAGAAASSLGRERLEVGNRWALEIIQERLGSRTAFSKRALTIQVERHGVGTRIGMILLGSVFAASFAALTAAAAVATVDRAGTDSLSSAVVPALATAGLAAIAAYGVALVVRGARGASRIPERDAKIGAKLAWISNSPAIRWAPVLVFIAGWFATGSIRDFLLLRGPSVAVTAWEILAVWMAWSLHVVAHEGGHAVAAVLLGGRVDEVAIGPVRFFRKEHAWWSARRPSGLVIGGHVRASFHGERHTRTRYLLHVAGGPAVSVTLAAVCAIPLFRGGVQDRVIERLLWAGLLAAGSGALGSLIPARCEGRQNDAQIVASVFRGAFWYGTVGRRLSAQLFARQRARDWKASPEEIESYARSSSDGGGWGFLLASARALDGGDPAVARRLLAEMLANAGLEQALRKEALLQAALVDALVDANPVHARQRIADALALGAGDYAKLAEAAAALAEGRNDEARVALAAWSRAVNGSEDPEQVRVGNHWALDTINEKLGTTNAVVRMH